MKGKKVMTDARLFTLKNDELVKLACGAIKDENLGVLRDIEVILHHLFMNFARNKLVSHPGIRDVRKKSDCAGLEEYMTSYIDMVLRITESMEARAIEDYQEIGAILIRLAHLSELMAAFRVSVSDRARGT